MSAIKPKTTFELIYCSVRESWARCVGGLTQVADRFAEAGRQALAHFEQRISRSHQHSSDGDRTHHELPHRIRHGRPVIRRICREILFDLRPKKINEQRNHQSPGQHAARELDGGQSKPDDVSDAQIGGTYARRRKGTRPARRHDILASGKTEPNLAASQTPDRKVKSLPAANRPKLPRM